MSLPNPKYQEILFLLLFARTQNQIEEYALIPLVMEQLKVSKTHLKAAIEYVKSIDAHLMEIDQKIQKLVIAYDFERIQSIEKTVLRLAAYELLFKKTSSHKSVISEALRLTKKFGTAAATSFVHAILDNLSKQAEGQPLNSQTVNDSIQQLKQDEIQIEQTHAEFIDQQFEK